MLLSDYVVFKKHTQGGLHMMSFSPFWEMLKRNNITVYMLEYDYELNPADISRLKHNHNYSLKSLNRFCNLFHCGIQDIVEFIPDEESSDNVEG
jgi:DNA-binding Xre family transcriptional regulator